MLGLGVRGEMLSGSKHILLNRDSETKQYFHSLRTEMGNVYKLREELRAADTVLVEVKELATGPHWKGKKERNDK